MLALITFVLPLPFVRSSLQTKPDEPEHLSIWVVDEWFDSERPRSTWMCSCGATGRVDGARVRHGSFDEDVSAWTSIDLARECRHCETPLASKIRDDSPRCVLALGLPIDPDARAQLRVRADDLWLSLGTDPPRSVCRRCGAVEANVPAAR